MATPKLYAWGWNTNAEEIDKLRDEIPGLGIIHYPHTYHKIRRGDIAYVNNAAQAAEVAEYGGLIAHAILSDERNIDGPSGSYETPEAYNKRIKEAALTLWENGIETSHKGLAIVDKDFDYDYASKIEVGDIRGANTHPLNFIRVFEAIGKLKKDKWFVTLIPWRLTVWPLKYISLFGFFLQHFHVPPLRRQIVMLATHPRVVGVGFWCLKEGKDGEGKWQSNHGIFNRHGKMTWQGKMIKRLIKEVL